MRLGEALGRCPSLALVPADPQRAEEAWEDSLATLEGIGAAVESRRPGEAFFGLDGLRALWGRPERALERARRLIGQGVRLGAGPTRLWRWRRRFARGRGAAAVAIVSEREARAFLARLEVGVLRDRMGDEWTGVNLVDTLERLGVGTLGELASLPDATPWPTASASRDCARWGWRAASRSRFAPASRAPSCARRSSSTTPPRPASSTGRSSSWSTACWRTRSAAGGASGACGSRRALPAVAAGGSRRPPAMRPPTASACSWCSGRSWRRFPRRRCSWRSAASSWARRRRASRRSTPTTQRSAAAG